jgi:hypothetical protein
MTSNGFKSDVRKHASEHGVNYTTALRNCTRYLDGVAGARADILTWGIPVDDGNESPNDWRFINALHGDDEGYEVGYRTTKLAEFNDYRDSLPAAERAERDAASYANGLIGHPHRIIAARRAAAEAKAEGLRRYQVLYQGASPTINPNSELSPGLTHEELRVEWAAARDLEVATGEHAEAPITAFAAGGSPAARHFARHGKHGVLPTLGSWGAQSSYVHRHATGEVVPAAFNIAVEGNADRFLTDGDIAAWGVLADWLGLAFRVGTTRNDTDRNGTVPVVFWNDQIVDL